MKGVHILVIAGIAVLITGLAASLAYKIYKSLKWKRIVLNKGYPGKEARRYFWMAFFKEQDASRLIIALPDRSEEGVWHHVQQDDPKMQ